MHILPLVFWGSAILSVGFSAAGLAARNCRWLVAGAILAIPMSFYLGATPRFQTWGWFLPGLQVVAAVVVRRSVALAGALLIPLVSLMLWLAVSAVSQNFGA